MNAFSRAKAAIFVGLYAFLAAGDVLAAEQDVRAIDSGLFKSTDINGDGKVSRKEIIHYADLVFISMDANGDETLTYEEFLQWDPGYGTLADESGKREEFNKAKQAAFKSKDLNKNGRLEYDEFSVSALYDFYRADANQNGSLSQDELIQNYQIIKDVRSAIE